MPRRIYRLSHQSLEHTANLDQLQYCPTWRESQVVVLFVVVVVVMVVVSMLCMSV